MRGDASNKWRREFRDLAAMKQQIDRFVAGEMAAFQQDRHSIFFGESAHGAIHRLSIFDCFAEQSCGFIEIRCNQSCERKQFRFVKSDGVGAKKLIAARRDHDRIDNQRDVGLACKVDKDSRHGGDDFARAKQSALDCRNGKTFREHLDLLAHNRAAQRLNARNFARRFRDDAGDGC